MNSTTKKMNSGRIKLTSKNISSGILRNEIKSFAKNSIVLSDKELLKLRRNIIPDHGIGKRIYIFAYGSLLWNPTFKYLEEIPASIFGYNRKFCMITKLGRGNIKNPGLMLGLDRGGMCQGSVYKLRKENEIKEIDLLFKREMITKSYIPKLIKTKLINGKNVTSLAFVMDQKNKNYLPNLDPKKIARMLFKASGILGNGEEYILNTILSLQELNFVDKRMNLIYDHIQTLKNN